MTASALQAMASSKPDHSITSVKDFRVLLFPSTPGLLQKGPLNCFPRQHEVRAQCLMLWLTLCELQNAALNHMTHSFHPC